MQFLVGGQVLRFDLVKFALITRINFDQYPGPVEITQMSSNRRLWETYMNENLHPKLVDLEDAFLSYQDVEDCWKLGFYYLVEGLLLVDEPWSKVNINFL